MSEEAHPPQRIGDVERDRAVDLLREHMAAGRLTTEEFDERLSSALGAKTLADLDPLFTDLPGPRPGQEVATTTPSVPWQTSAAPAAAVPSAPDRGPAAWNTALTVLTAVMWPATILLLFATSWDYWWLIFVPIMISSVLGKNHQDRERKRERIEREQRDLDRRRRALEDRSDP